LKWKEELKFADTLLLVTRLTIIWPNFSHIGPVAADLEFKMHAQLAQIFISRNKGQENFDPNEISGTLAASKQSVDRKKISVFSNNSSLTGNKKPSTFSRLWALSC